MKKILIIDDSPFMTQMFSIKIHQEGYEPLIAGDGKTGLTMAQVESPVCVLLDISMPQMNGWEVLDSLKKDARTVNIPVIILTNSRGNEEDIKKAKDKGAVEFLMKVGQKVDDIIKIVKKYA